jgi:hypothetical protein
MSMKKNMIYTWFVALAMVLLMVASALAVSVRAGASTETDTGNVAAQQRVHVAASGNSNDDDRDDGQDDTDNDTVRARSRIQADAEIMTGGGQRSGPAPMPAPMPARGNMNLFDKEQVRIYAALPVAIKQRVRLASEEDAKTMLRHYMLVNVTADTIAHKRLIHAQEQLQVRRDVAERRLAADEAGRVEARQMYMKSRAALQECRQGEGDCAAIEEDVEEDAQALLLRNIEVAIQHLNSTKYKIASSQEIEAELAAELVASIDADIQVLQEYKAEAEAAEDKERIQEIARDVREALGEIKKREKVYRAALFNTRVWNVVKRSELLEHRMQITLNSTANDSAEIEAQVTVFSEHIQASKDAYNDAQVAVVAALGDEQERFIDDAHANMRKAHEELKEAHDVLIEIVRLLRQERLDLPEHASYEIAAKAEGSA